MRASSSSGALVYLVERAMKKNTAPNTKSPTAKRIRGKYFFILGYFILKILLDLVNGDSFLLGGVSVP